MRTYGSTTRSESVGREQFQGNIHRACSNNLLTKRMSPEASGDAMLMEELPFITWTEFSSACQQLEAASRQIDKHDFQVQVYGEEPSVGHQGRKDAPWVSSSRIATIILKVDQGSRGFDQGFDRFLKIRRTFTTSPVPQPTCASPDEAGLEVDEETDSVRILWMRLEALLLMQVIAHQSRMSSTLRSQTLRNSSLNMILFSPKFTVCLCSMSISLMKLGAESWVWNSYTNIS